MQAQGSELRGGQYDGLNANTKWTLRRLLAADKLPGIKHWGIRIWVLHADSKELAKPILPKDNGGFR